MKDSTKSVITLLVLFIVPSIFVYNTREVLGSQSIIIVPILLVMFFFLVYWVAFNIEKLTNHVKNSKDMTKRRNKERELFRSWFDDNHEENYYDYGWRYRNIMEIEYMMKELKEEQDNKLREYYDKTTHDEVINDEEQERLQNIKGE